MNMQNLGYGAESWFWLFLANAARGGVLLLAAAVCAWALRRSSAAKTHALWALALLAVLGLPVMSGFLPAISVALPAPSPGEARLAVTQEIPGLHRDGPPSAGLAPPGTMPSESPEPSSTGTGYGWPALILSLWLIGAGVALFPNALGLLILRRHIRGATLLDGPEWSELLGLGRAHMGVRQHVRLLMGREEGVPVMWGVFRPGILLPPSALSWTQECRRAVIEHELAHVRRRDFLTQLAALLVRALHWFNPLAWLALAALRNAAERACDDLVLVRGCEPSAYAGQLVAVCRTLRRPVTPAHAGVAMARPSTLEQRVREVLDPHRDRRGVPGRVLAIMGLMALLTSGLVATLQPTARAEAPAPTLTIQPLADQLDATIRSEWRAQGAATAEQLRDRLQAETAACVNNRIKKAELKGITLKKAEHGALEVSAADPADLASVREVLLRRGVLGFHEVASRDETLLALKRLKENPDNQQGQQDLFPILEVDTTHRPPSVPAKDRAAVQAILAKLNQSGLLSPGWVLTLGRVDAQTERCPLYMMKSESPLSQVRVESAVAASDPDVPGTNYIQIAFSPEDGARFGELTQALIGKPLGIVLDGEVQSAPVVRDKITMNAQSTGSFSPEEARLLASVLRAGAFPAPVQIEERRGTGLIVPLVDSGTLELVAVRKHQSPDAAFWRPDGTPLADPPFAQCAVRVEPRDSAYEFVYRMPRASRSQDLQFHYDGARSMGSASAELADGSTAGDLSVQAVALDGKETADIRINSPSGEWKAVIAQEPAGSSSYSTDAYAVTFSEPYLKDDAVHVTLTLGGPIREKATRLVAVDTAGKIHESNSRQGGGGDAFFQCTYGFDHLGLEDVKEFQLQSCDWRVIEFRNVSLVSGRHSDCTASAITRTTAEAGR